MPAEGCLQEQALLTLQPAAVICSLQLQALTEGDAPERLHSSDERLVRRCCMLDIK